MGQLISVEVTIKLNVRVKKKYAAKGDVFLAAKDSADLSQEMFILHFSIYFVAKDHVEERKATKHRSHMQKDA